LACVASDLAQAQARSHQDIPEASAPPLYHDDAAQTLVGDENTLATHPSSDQSIPDRIPEWAQYPIQFLCDGKSPGSQRLWLLSRAGDRWWFDDKGWRTFQWCDPAITLAPVPAEATPPGLAAFVIPAINEASADAGAADIASSNAEGARALAEAAAAHATVAAAQAQASSLRAAQELDHLTRGLFQAATHRSTQLQMTTAAEDLTHRAVIQIGAAQEEIANPPPPPADIGDNAWHSTLRPARIPGTVVADNPADAIEDAPSTAALEHATEEPEEHALSSAHADTAAILPLMPAAAPGGILAMFPAMPSLSVVFPWPATGCTPSATRMAQIQARRRDRQ